MPFSLPDLPFAMDALEPHMSRETLEYHFGKHHAGYVKKLNAAVEASPELQGKTLEALVQSTEGGTFNNAAQVWNHTFFWNCLNAADDSQEPSEVLAKALTDTFGSIDAFKEQFSAAAAGNFGSGWTWLIADANGQLVIHSTTDAETPASDPALTPLMTIDVWEHAYYIDYRNDRAAYIDNYWQLLNWSFVSENFASSGIQTEAA